jgi:hypothetical protein
MKSPDFFLVGAPKSGTTAMHAFLQEHPEIFMPEYKEIHYYGSDLSALASQLNAQQHDALFVNADGARRVGETCIWALYSKNASEEIRREVPHAQIIIMLRDLVSMVYALHSEFIYWRIENIGDFEQAMRAEEDRKQGRRLPPTVRTPGYLEGEPPCLLYYREIVRYAAQVERYFQSFGRDRVHVILFDDFQRDLHGVYRRLLEFLDVDPTFQPQFRVVNPNKRVRSLMLRDWLDQPIPLAQSVTKLLIPSAEVRERWKKSLQQWNVGYAPRRQMNPRFEAELRHEFAEDVRRLSGLLNRDLSAWLPGGSSG